MRKVSWLLKRCELQRNVIHARFQNAAGQIFCSLQLALRSDFYTATRKNQSSRISHRCLFDQFSRDFRSISFRTIPKPKCEILLSEFFRENSTRDSVTPNGDVSISGLCCDSNKTGPNHFNNEHVNCEVKFCLPIEIQVQ